MKQVAKSLREAIRTGKGAVVARFFDINHLNKNVAACRDLVSHNISQVLGHDLWMESFSYLFQVPLQNTVLESFNMYNQASAPLIRSFKDLATTLSVPCIKSIARSLRFFAANADYNESVNQMQKLLRLALSARNAATDESSLLSVVNELMSVYSLKNNFKQMENLLKNVEAGTGGRIAFSQYSQSEVACFHFNRGRICAISSQIKAAYENLMHALSKCPLTQPHNRRLILCYLVPVQMCCGMLANEKGILEKYGLGMFRSFTSAAAWGDIARFDAALDEHQLTLIKLGLFQMMMKVKRIVFFRFLKMVHENYGDSKIPVDVVHSAVSVLSKYTMNEVESIVAVLIEEKMLKAYIYHTQRMRVIVFKRENAFVSLGPELYAE
jgi:hypothetical protein